MTWTIKTNKLPKNATVEVLEKLTRLHTDADLSTGKVHSIVQTTDYIRFRVGDQDIIVEERKTGEIPL